MLFELFFDGEAIGVDLHKTFLSRLSKNFEDIVDSISVTFGDFLYFEKKSTAFWYLLSFSKIFY